MNAKGQRHAKYFKLVLYILVVVLVNLAGLTLFFRYDLTHDKIYSLSPVSKDVVTTLTEPLTVKVFFSRDLPAPYNTNELYLRDLLGEYAMHNPRYFKVQFYRISPEADGRDQAVSHQQMARDYGIHPIQIQIVEKDELKFRQAYMGLVLIHGDIIERIPTLATTDGLEYKLTTAIQKLNHKVSALLALEEPITTTLVLSSSLHPIAPLIGLEDLGDYTEQIKALIRGIGARAYGKVVFEHLDPSGDPSAAEAARRHNLRALSWPDLPDAEIRAGEGHVGLLMRYRDKVREIPLLSVVRLPIFGDQYQLASIEQIENVVNTNIERLIEINEALGYLSDFGTLDLAAGPFGPQEEALTQFNALINQTYSITPVYLKEDAVAPGLQTLVIARPTETFSDHDLFQIDQALMRGTNLALFLDVFEQQQMQQQPFMAQQMPMHVPLDTGLEKLLAHYGVTIGRALVMDEKCYRQRLPQQQGGGEQPIYFAPLIANERIANDLDYLKNIKGLIALEISPLELDETRIEAQTLTARMLFASSDRSWEMREPIMLNPMLIHPPASDSEMESRPLAYLLEGVFTSYFKGQPIPEKPVDADPAEGGPASEGDPGEDPGTERMDLGVDLSGITGEDVFREQSVPAKLLVIGSSKMISDQLLDQAGQTPNSMFILNMIDALNGREAVAAMRSKEQRFNPLDPVSPGTKTGIKVLNVAGLPLLVVLFGLLIWWRRHARQRLIQKRFAG